MRTIFATLFFCCVSLLGFAQHDHSAMSSMSNPRFNKIESLVGDWHGTYQWIGTSVHGDMGARYYMTGHGSAVVEDLLEDGKPIMTSVYHMDGADLRVTHFCVANQPRLKADTTSDKANSIVFQFVDITNLTAPGVGHVVKLELQFIDANKVTIFFTYSISGKERIEQIDLTRTV